MQVTSVSICQGKKGKVEDRTRVRQRYKAGKSELGVRKSLFSPCSPAEPAQFLSCYKADGVARP